MSLVSGMLTIALGFAVSGATASAYEGVTGRRAGFAMLRAPDVTAVAAVPVVTLGAAYILARNVLFGRPRPAWAVAAGAVATGLWSLVIGAATLAALV